MPGLSRSRLTVESLETRECPAPINEITSYIDASSDADWGGIVFRGDSDYDFEGATGTDASVQYKILFAPLIEVLDSR